VATSATNEHLRRSAARWWTRSVLNASSETHWLARWWRVEGPCGLTFEFTRLRKRAKPAVAGRVQRRVSPWPDNTFVAKLSASIHARTLPEATVQAQLADAPTVEGAQRAAVSLGAAFVQQGARSIVAMLGGSRAVLA
jgi:hypothetical protein